jgi:hypothetical protein
MLSIEAGFSRYARQEKIAGGSKNVHMHPGNT